MRKVYYLESCSTCQKIMKEMDLSDFTKVEIKSMGIQQDQLEEMYKYAGTYESLFSRRAMKFRSMGLNTMDLKEEDYKKYILEEYTFLKRPVFLIDDEIFIGNSKKVVEAAIKKLS